MSAPHAEGERQELIAAARTLAVTLTDAQARTLLRLLDELSMWNRAYNLTAITERSVMIRDHLLDSLSAASELGGARIADVGTGAGFPGLPLAVIAPERSFTLIDSVAKKIRFVAHAARELALTNVMPLQARVEQLRPEAPFDTIVTRAFAALPLTLARIDRLAAAGTRLIALKGRYPREELAQLPSRWALQSVRRVSLPGSDAERHIVPAGAAAYKRGLKARGGAARPRLPVVAPRLRIDSPRHEARHRRSQPERRGRQNHVGGQSGGIVRRSAASRAADRHRSSGQCHHRLRHR